MTTATVTAESCMHGAVYAPVLRALVDDPLALLSFCRVDRAALATARWLRCEYGGQSVYQRARRRMRAAKIDGIRLFAYAVGPRSWDRVDGPGGHHPHPLLRLDPWHDARQHRDLLDFALRGGGPDAWFAGCTASVRHDAQRRSGGSVPLPWREARVDLMPPAYAAGEDLLPVADAPDPPVARALFVVVAELGEHDLESWGPAGLQVSRYGYYPVSWSPLNTIRALLPMLEPAYGMHFYVLRRRCSYGGVCLDVMVGLAPR